MKVGLFIYCLIGSYLFFAGFLSFAEWDLSFFDPQVWSKGARAGAFFIAFAVYGGAFINAELSQNRG